MERGQRCAARDTAVGGGRNEGHGERVGGGGRQVKGARRSEKSIEMVEKRREHTHRGPGTVESSGTVGPGALFNKSQLMRVIDHHRGGKGVGEGAGGGWGSAGDRNERKRRVRAARFAGESNEIQAKGVSASGVPLEISRHRRCSHVRE